MNEIIEITKVETPKCKRTPAQSSIISLAWWVITHKNATVFADKAEDILSMAGSIVNSDQRRHCFIDSRGSNLCGKLKKTPAIEIKEVKQLIAESGFLKE